ncbi:hypothetical protein BC351_18665 [Paenibacillus ferrarius]|uniref:Glycosyltransferase 2-like domain-containing protein n=1 Tax=Paenibacillus ferrarius TaxID=1469647 RepID=A0A1V4HPI1_9BACL|nr:glycosyltransferase family 2 protein [Paenibacillus ferrarius]OPH59947.1 hypothetical protein BC351_18665 [Paenibacillus ferrarius]
MKHSIVVPVNQDFNILTLFTESLMKSIGPSSQIIFINDGSGPKVQELLERLQREAPAGVKIEIIRHEYPRGCAVSINEALSTVEGDYIHLLDSDIILNPNWQEKMEATLNSSPTIGMAGGVLLYPQTGGIQHCGITFADTIGRHLFLNATLEDIPREIFEVQMVVFAMFTMKREVFEKVGYLDEKFFNGYEDFDYQMRAKAAGYSTVINPEIRAYHWERSSGIHRSFNRKNNLARFWKKWGNDIYSDIWDFTLSNLKSRLSSNNLKHGLAFTGIDLAEVRSDAETFWDQLQKSGLVSLTDVHDYSSRFQSNGSIWLPQVLGKELIHSSSRLLFLVDNFTRLLDNRYWIEIRRNASSEDLIIDLYGNVVMINQIYESCWPGTKVR